MKQDEIKVGDSFLVINPKKDYKPSIILHDLEDKNITILVSKKERGIRLLKGVANINCNYYKDRVFIEANNILNCNIQLIPTNLKRNRVYIEDVNSNKLRKTLNRKYKV